MWSTLEFSKGLNKFYPQNRESISRAAFLIGKHCGGSFSRSLGNGFRQTVAGILSKEQMNTSEMLEGHIQATLSRCQGSPSSTLVVSQDTTYYNYSGQQQMEGLGVIQGNVKGTLQHNALVMDDTGLPLGLIYQRNWTRGGQNKWEVESQKWFAGLDAVNEQLGEVEKSVVLVQDREADIFDFFKAERSPSVDLIIRVFQNRNIEHLNKEDTSKILSLKDSIEKLAKLGEFQVRIRRDNKDLDLTLSLQAQSINVFPRKDLSPRLHKTQRLNLVIATEIKAVDPKGKDCFEPQKAVQWLLLTSLPIEELAQAQKIVHYYSLRWQVERFHYTLKSGALKVEKLQFDDVATTFNALALYSIVAWRILFLTLSVRKYPRANPTDYFSQKELKVLKIHESKADQSLAKAVTTLGKIVKFVPTTKQPYPGIKILAEALNKLNTLVEFIDLIPNPLPD